MCHKNGPWLIYYEYMEISVYNPDIDFDSALSLYSAVGWTTYTDNPKLLEEGLRNSSLVLISMKDARLVGLIRCISDGYTICYIQDILVDPGHQRVGVGKALIDQILNHYSHIRQVVLMTDDKHSQREFYQASGFREIKDDLRGFVLIRV